MKSIFFVALLGFGPTGSGSFPDQKTFHSIVVQNERPAQHNTWIVDYDCDFIWVAQHFGSDRDVVGNTPAGVFVHSKTHDRWLKVLSVKANGAKFGKSPPDLRISSPWDFTHIGPSEFVPLPIPTPGAVHFPDKIVYVDRRETFLMYFHSRSNIESSMTMLVIPKKDLTAAFDHYAKRK
jgi:hypothetical protein